MRFIVFETFLHFRERAYRSHVGNDLIFIVNIAFNDVILCYLTYSIFFALFRSTFSTVSSDVPFQPVAQKNVEMKMGKY